MPAILKATRQVAASSKLVICSLAGGKYIARANNHVVKPELDNTMIMIDSSRDMRNFLISGSVMPHSIAQASYLITNPGCRLLLSAMAASRDSGVDSVPRRTARKSFHA